MIALIIGNTDGIGLAVTKMLLNKGWSVVGISRSDSLLVNPTYIHFILDVGDKDFPDSLGTIIQEKGPFDLCIYCVGIGDLLNFSNLDFDVKVVNVNLLGLIKTVSKIIPSMLSHDKGHFIGLSSFADEMLSEEAPSYHASKAGFSSYLESLALAMKNKPVFITNLRFGFVDTKMAKGDVKPMIMSADKAAEYVKKCIDEKPARYTVPKMAIPLVKFRRLVLNLKVRFQ